MTQLSIQDAIRLALQHQHGGRLSDAEALYRQVLASAPRQADALHLLGLVRFQLGDPAAAIDLIGRAIAVSPRIAAFHNNLGNVLKIVGRVDEAIASYEAAIRIDPSLLSAYQNLVMLLQTSGEIARAIEMCRAAIRLRPNLAEAWNHLGNLLSAQCETAEAVAAFERAVELRPDLAIAWSNLGNELLGLGKTDEAIGACRNAVRLDPAMYGAHNNLANALRARGATAEAIEAYQRAISLNPSCSEAYGNLGGAFSDQGRLDEAIEAYRQSLHLDPTAHYFHSNLVAHLNASDRYSGPEIYEEHRRWEAIQAAAVIPEHHEHHNSADPDRRLRIGYVSPDFRRHSVAYFAEAFLAHHDHSRYEIVCYDNASAFDEVTRRLRACADQWHTITKLSDAQLAERIRGDRVDILVDLAGHLRGGRLLTFARKPAPVQVTYLGYPATTGLSAIDYRITDAYADPPGRTEALHSERLLRLPKCFLCYRIPEELPLVEPLPALSAGHVSFGSFNNFARVSDAVLSVWGQILSSVENSSLILKSRGLGDAGTRAKVMERLRAQDIATERVTLLGHARSYQEHMKVYGRIDIALDTFPYNGTTTTCEALAMGVPVICLVGERHVSRVGLSILTNADSPEWAGDSHQRYVEIARGLAGDLNRLATLRSGLRQRMRESALCDEVGFTRDLESAYRQMWSQWCAGKRVGAGGS